MLTVKILDEFYMTHSTNVQTTEEAMEIISMWLKHRDETPIYEITVEIND